MVSPFGFSLASWPWRLFVAQPLWGLPSCSVWARTCHASALQTGHHLVHFVGQRVHGALRVFSPVTAWATFFHHSWASLGVVGHVGAGGRPGHAPGCGRTPPGHPAWALRRSWPCSGCRTRGSASGPPRWSFQRGGLGGHELGIEPGGGSGRLASWSLKKVQLPTSW